MREADSLDGVLADIAELARLHAEGRPEAKAALALRHADLAEMYAAFDDEQAAASWDEGLALAAGDRLARGEVCESRADVFRRRDAHTEASRWYAEAADDYFAVAAWNPYLHCMNEFGVQRERAGLPPNGTYRDALKALAKLPELPPTIDHARLWLNASLEEKSADGFRRAIALYEQFPKFVVEHARTYHSLGDVLPANERRDAYAKAIAMLEPHVAMPDALNELAAVHHAIGLRAREDGRFTDAIPSQNRALELISDLCDAHPTLRNRGARAAYRAALALALGGAHLWSLAVEEGTAAVAELEALLLERIDLFWQTLRRQVVKELPEWTLRRDRPAQTEAFHCTFCAKSQREVKKLISGPKIFICDECVALCNDILVDKLGGEPRKQSRTCNFCGESLRRAMVAGPEVVICDDCVGLCNDIIEEEIKATQPVET